MKLNNGVKYSNKKGFSLVELLLAATFTAVIVLAFVRMLIGSTIALDSTTQKEQNVNLAKYYGKTIQVMNNYEWNGNGEGFIEISDGNSTNKYVVTSGGGIVNLRQGKNQSFGIEVKFPYSSTNYNLIIETVSLDITNLAGMDENDFLQLWVGTDDILAIAGAQAIIVDNDGTEMKFELYYDEIEFANKYNGWYHFTGWIRNAQITGGTITGFNFSNISKAKLVFNIKANYEGVVYFDNIGFAETIGGLGNVSKIISDKYQLIETTNKWILTPILTDPVYGYLSNGTGEPLGAIDFNDDIVGYGTLITLQSTSVGDNSDGKHSSIVYGQKFIVTTTFLKDKNFSTVLPVYAYE